METISPFVALAFRPTAYERIDRELQTILTCANNEMHRVMHLYNASISITGEITYVLTNDKMIAMCGHVYEEGEPKVNPKNQKPLPGHIPCWLCCERKGHEG